MKRLALLVCLLASATASADTRTLDPAVTIRFSDLNLSSIEGNRVLYGRIRSAAQEVCGPTFSLWDKSRWSSWKACYGATVDRAVTQIDQPLLTALHERSKRVAGR
jgi:UrcA family protein